MDRNGQSFHVQVPGSSESRCSARCPDAGRQHISYTAEPQANGRNPRSYMPFRSDPNFVGREQLLTRLFARFEGARHHNRAALVGLAGVGKSHVAVEFANRWRTKHPECSIFWIRATTTTHVRQSFHEIAAALQLPGHDRSSAEVLPLVRNWLSEPTNGQWVLIVDDADDAKVFYPGNAEDEGPATSDSVQKTALRPLHFYIPQSAHGHVLITSRNQAGSLLALGRHNTETVDDFDSKTAVALFHTLLPPQAFDRRAARKLADLLACVPLAIRHAASYIRRTRVSIRKYRAVYEECAGRSTYLLAKPWMDARRESSAQIATGVSWQVSYEQVRTHSRRAASLLLLLSMTDIHALLPLRLSYSDDAEHAALMSLLVDFSLITANDPSDPWRGYGMHRLVQLATWRWLESHNVLLDYQRSAATTILGLFPHSALTPTLRQECEALLPHALLAITYDVGTRVPRYYLLPWQCGRLCFEQGQLDLAWTLLAESMSLCKDEVGKDHVDMCLIGESLVRLLVCRNNIEGALLMQQAVLHNYTELFGQADPRSVNAAYAMTKLHEMHRQLQKTSVSSDSICPPSKWSMATDHSRTSLLSLERIVYGVSLGSKKLAGSFRNSLHF